MASIGHLAAGVAHEINNPIGFIKSNLGAIDDYRGDLEQLIEDFKLFFEKVKNNVSAEDTALRPMINHIDELMDRLDVPYILEDFPKVIFESHEGVERVARIVMDLKKFSHTGEDQRSCSDINEGIESTLNVAWNELKYRANVKKRLAKLPLVKCNIQKINQVVLNLLVNAAQSIEGKGEIRIETRHNDDWVEIAISDTGCGIADEHLSQIFDPFFTTKPVGKGSGLGLNVSYNIIQSHAGTIQVESAVGSGTTFTIRLPIDGNPTAAYPAYDG
jgi:signal transduction histidine kinase